MPKRRYVNLKYSFPRSGYADFKYIVRFRFNVHEIQVLQGLYRIF